MGKEVAFMTELDMCRQDIEEIDKQLVELFEKRMEVAVKVAEYKKERNLPIYDKERESQLIQRNVKYLKNGEYEILLRRFFLHVMELSRSLQSDMMKK